MRPPTDTVSTFRPLLRPHVKRFTTPTGEFCSLYREFTEDTAFIKRFTGKVFCDVAFVEDVPAGFQWTSLGDSEIPSLNAMLRLCLGDAYLVELYVRPAYRGKGLAPFVEERVYRELSTLGYRRMFVLIEVGNRRMIRLAKKMGFDPYYLISISRLAPVERLIATPCRPEFAGALRVERVGRGLLPFRRPRWALTVVEPEAEGSLLR